MMTVEEVADILKVKETTVRTWLKSGKLQGSKVGNSWRITKESLQELFPVEKVGFLEDVSDIERPIYKALYQKEYEETLEHDRLTEEAMERQQWSEKFYEKHREKLEQEIPYPYTANDVFQRHPDGTIQSTGADLYVWEGYYEGKLKESKGKYDNLFESLKKKYNVTEAEIEDVKQTAYKIKLLELAGIKDR